MQPEPSGQPANVTVLLARATSGDARATDELFPLIYDELRQLASQHLKAERRGHTLQPTALVHEAYLRLVGPGEVTWENRGHFFGAAARAIRRILTDHARTRGRRKRGGGGPGKRVPLNNIAADDGPDGVDLIALDQALESLARLDPQKARVVELRFFGGLTGDETARSLGISPSTVARDWDFARVWLKREMSTGETA